MMDSGWDINEISGLLTAISTGVITPVNILLCLLTYRAFSLQTNSNYSLNHQSILQSHRDLFFGLLHRPELLKKFADANSIPVDDWELKIISACFINHVFVHYLNFANQTIDASYMEGFRQDAQELFCLPTVQEHWQQSKVGYSIDFRKFVEEQLLMSIQKGPEPSSIDPTVEVEELKV